MMRFFPPRLSSCLLTALVVIPGAPLGSAELPWPEEAPPVVEHFAPADIAALPPHPRVLATSTRWERLRTQIREDAVSRQLYELLRARAHELVGLPPVVYDFRAGNHLSAISQAQARIMVLAAMYRLEGDAKYAEAARAVMHGLADQAWGTGHFLDNASGAMALGIGFDWLYDALSEAEREKFARKMEDEALDWSVREEPRMRTLWANHNWNQVSNAGLVLGALALAERNPSRTLRIVNRTVSWLPFAAAAYAPDGVFPEGPGYWGYGTTHHVLLVTAIEEALGTSAGLAAFPGFLESVEFVNQATGPTGLTFAFGDGRESRGFQAAPFWFARHAGDIGPAMWDLDSLHRIHRNWQLNAPGERETVAELRSTIPSGRDLPLALIWWDPQRTPPDTTARPASRPLAWSGRGVQPVAMMRTEWDSPEATFLAVKGGIAGHHHGHMDVGSFVIDAKGVRWAIDPGVQDYAKVRAGGISHREHFNLRQDSVRWSIFRNGADAHNILRFNSEPQRVEGRAELRLEPATSGIAHAVVDLTPVVGASAERVTRRAELMKEGTIRIRDEWRATTDAAVQWQWMTRANVEVSADRLVLRQAGQVAELGFNASSPVEVVVADVAEPRNPAIDDANPDLKRIELRLRTAAGDTGHLEVTFRAH